MLVASFNLGARGLPSTQSPLSGLLFFLLLRPAAAAWTYTRHNQSSVAVFLVHFKLDWNPVKQTHVCAALLDGKANPNSLLLPPASPLLCRLLIIRHPIFSSSRLSPRFLPRPSAGGNRWLDSNGAFFGGCPVCSFAHYAVFAIVAAAAALAASCLVRMLFLYPKRCL